VVTALYLAHLNPVTNAHTQIILDLAGRADRVKVMPVVFRDGDTELNSRSFPFGFDVRKRMLRAAVDDGRVTISDDYVFEAPFKRYMPPLLSRRSWSLRRHILQGVEDDYFSYTGDGAEGLMLRLYRLRPQVGKRRPLSAASVKARLYEAASGGPDAWREDVPEEVARIIDEEWDTVEGFAGSPDDTMRVCGMKFPKSGW
jgi:hypothetical protein